MPHASQARSLRETQAGAPVNTVCWPTNESLCRGDRTVSRSSPSHCAAPNALISSYAQYPSWSRVRDKDIRGDLMNGQRSAAASGRFRWGIRAEAPQNEGNGTVAPWKEPERRHLSGAHGSRRLQKGQRLTAPLSIRVGALPAVAMDLAHGWTGADLSLRNCAGGEQATMMRLMSAAYSPQSTPVASFLHRGKRGAALLQVGGSMTSRAQSAAVEGHTVGGSDVTKVGQHKERARAPESTMKAQQPAPRMAVGVAAFCGQTGAKRNDEGQRASD
ncbi:hypothetical protein IWX49DRAFT_196786 [Phyllosticta citricarpa]|uniref:Uncharacterized protein n=1 Tax=Phyllosticta paracitricarpa TaxID=2016321 RepID=A0ABR1MZU3_9PEZI